jgi:Protein of unknown function (DUF3047)
MRYIPSAILIAVIAVCSVSFADQGRRLDFKAEQILKWEKKSFKGETDYRLITENGRRVIQADSRGSASGLFAKVDLDPAAYRYLSWSWKIKSTISNANEKSKSGDDYAARVYVVFPGRFFWQTKAINYIWANNLPKGQSVPNAFTSNAVMLAVESGQDNVGKWLTARRDVVADYKRLFGSEPDRIGAIAIMTDTDNTGAQATAWYGDISIAAEK